jgi:putative transposase
MSVFRNLTEARELTESWMIEYNYERPNDSLEGLTPWEYLAKHQRAENSNQQ